MEEWKFLDLVILLLLSLMFVMTTLIFVQTIGEGQLAFLGWIAVLAGIVAFARLVSRRIKVEVSKWLDLTLIVIGLSVYGLFQTSVTIIIFRDDLTLSPLSWMIPLMLILTVIGLSLYRHRRP